MYFVVTLNVFSKESKNLSYSVSPATDAMTTSLKRISPPIQNIGYLVAPGRVLFDDATHVTIGSIIRTRHLGYFVPPIVVTSEVMAEGIKVSVSPCSTEGGAARSAAKGGRKNLPPVLGNCFLWVIV